MAILTGLAFQPIAFDVPGGDPTSAKAVNLGILSWQAATQYIIDPTQNNQLLEMQNIQSIFVDNYLTTATTTITVAGTGHVIRVNGKSQCFMPLIASDRPVITITNAGGAGTSQVWLLNIPALGVIWTLP